MNTLAQKKFKVLLIGDTCTDEYQYGTVDRISPEAPVPVFKFSHTEKKPGMADNVKLNLNALGIETILIQGEKSTKTRLIDIRSKQQIVRIDNDVITKEPLSLSVIPNELLQVDAIVISDYNKGLVSYELIESIRREYKGPIFLDTKKQDLSRFHGIYVKINEVEYKARHSINDTLVVTLGNRGAMYKRYDDERYYEIPKVEVADVCGAGDTFLAALTFMFLETNDINSAIEFANRASSITVRHIGNYAPKLEEIDLL